MATSCSPYTIVSWNSKFIAHIFTAPWISYVCVYLSELKIPWVPHYLNYAPAHYIIVCTYLSTVISILFVILIVNYFKKNLLWIMLITSRNNNSSYSFLDPSYSKKAWHSFHCRWGHSISTCFSRDGESIISKKSSKTHVTTKYLTNSGKIEFTKDIT